MKIGASCRPPIANTHARVCIDVTLVSSRNDWSDGGISFNQVFEYLNDGSYPNGFDKNDKRVLRKRADFFAVKDTKLYHTSGEFLDML